MKIKVLVLFFIILVVLKVKADLTQEEKDTFLNFYMKNRYRNNDKRKNIKEVYWNDELANIAQVIYLMNFIEIIIKIKKYKYDINI